MQDNALSKTFNNIIFCPFHSFHPCCLNCFRKASKPCPFSPRKGKETISNSYRESHASALKTRSFLCGCAGTRRFGCPGSTGRAPCAGKADGGTRREKQHQLRSSAAVPRGLAPLSASQRSGEALVFSTTPPYQYTNGTPKCARSVPARNGEANRQKGLFCTSTT